MVAVVTVRVTVRNFFRRRGAHVLDYALEQQALPGQRVIAVDHHLALGDIGNGIDHPAVIVLALRARGIGEDLPATETQTTLRWAIFGIFSANGG